MDYNPFLPEVRDNPYPYYAYLRQEAPVYQVPGIGFWAISRYEDVLFALKNPHLFSSANFMNSFLGDLNPFPPEAPALVSSDPPSHTRLRKLVNRAFTPRRVASLEAHIREVTRERLAQVPVGEEFDLISELAIPLPGIVIAELLGVPPERRADFRRWTDTFMRGANGGMMVPPEEHAEILQGNAEFKEYCREAIAAYRKQPGDNLLSDLVRAEEENQTLTGEEILSLAVLLLIGGNETTTNLIGNATLALCRNPQELARVRANPALVPQVVEETLRYDAPVQWLLRQTTQDVKVAGTTIPAGAVVMIMFAAANRDEHKFSQPDRFDILRNPEGHLEFGFGIHFCLGAQLARLEGRLALEGLLERFPHFSRHEAPVTRFDSIFLRGPKTLPLVVG